MVCRAAPRGYPILRAVKLLGDQLAVPRQNGFGSNDLGDFGKRFSSQSFGRLRQAITFRIGQPDPAFDLVAQDSILRHQRLIWRFARRSQK